MHIFLSAFDDVPDPRAENARHDLGELLVIAFVSVLCGATSCAEMSAFGRAKESIFRDFLKGHVSKVVEILRRRPPSGLICACV